jgi:regulatory protein
VQRSLKARAVQWLAQREQSQAELRRKLLPYAKAEVQTALEALDADMSQHVRENTLSERIDKTVRVRGKDLATTQDCFCTNSASKTAHGGPQNSTLLTESDSKIATASERVEAVINWLQAHQYLCDTRFAESRANARSERFGNLRIRRELQQHQVALSPETAQSLAASEVDRACAVRERKFGDAPTTAVERAKQSHFLASRGFSSESIQSAMRQASKKNTF